MLSHELRTPLHGVLGYADQLLRDSKLNVAQVRQIGEIVRSAKHMRDVVNVVLDYARVEALGPALHMQEIDVLSWTLAVFRVAGVESNVIERWILG
jgi:signal transduction histidine kinase